MWNLEQYNHTNTFLLFKLIVEWWCPGGGKDDHTNVNRSSGFFVLVAYLLSLQVTFDTFIKILADSCEEEIEKPGGSGFCLESPQISTLLPHYY